MLIPAPQKDISMVRPVTCSLTVNCHELYVMAAAAGTSMVILCFPALSIILPFTRSGHNKYPREWSVC